jgi:hypothetical protein
MNIARTCVFLFCLVITHTAMAVIYRYQIYVHPAQGDALCLFSDLHIDTSNQKTTSLQIEQLSTFMQLLTPPKEVIVEDTASLVSQIDEDLVIPETFYTNKGPRGKNLTLIQTSVLLYVTLGYGIQNIPTYNIEFRLPGVKTRDWSFDDIVKQITLYNDGPILAPHYKEAISEYKKHGVNFYSLVRLLDVNILHRIFHNIHQKLKTQIVIAGGAHIDNIINALEDLGYKKINDQGITTQQAMNIMNEKVNEAIAAARQNKSKARFFKKGKTTPEGREHIDKIYQDMIQKIALNLSNLAKNLGLIKKYEQEASAAIAAKL